MLYASLAHIPFPMKQMGGMKSQNVAVLVIDNFFVAQIEEILKEMENVMSIFRWWKRYRPIGLLLRTTEYLFWESTFSMKLFGVLDTNSKPS